MSQYFAQIVPELSQEISDKLVSVEKKIHGRLLLLETALLSAPPNYSYRDCDFQKDGLSIATSRRISGFGKREGTLNDSTHQSTYTHSDMLISPLLRCSCPPVEKRGHRTRCRFSFASPKDRELQGSLKLFKSLVQYKIAVTYSRRSQLLDFQIHSNITMRAICCPESPAFRVLYEVRDKLDWYWDSGITATEQVGRELSNCLSNLQKLFSEGKAWPTDSLASGTSLLHVRGPISTSHALL